MKLAFVVQRYGADIAGGSEAHCRDLAHRLAGRHEITVLTSCARDYVTWENEYPAGSSVDGGVRVLRFAVERPRHMHEFSSLSDEVFEGGASHERQEAWFRENGPQVPELLDHLREHGSSYDLVLFWTFRYYPSFFGVPLVRDRAVLVPDRGGGQGDLARCPGGVFQAPDRLPVPHAGRAGAGVRTSRPAATSIGRDRNRARACRRHCRAATRFAHTASPTTTSSTWGESIGTRGATRCWSTSRSTRRRRHHHTTPAGGSGQDADPGASADPIARLRV